MANIIPGSQAIQDSRGNDHKTWNRGKTSDMRSEFMTDASNRIIDGFAEVKPRYNGPLLSGGAPVFAMGSCFAREIEAALTRMGGNVISVDDTIDREEFRDDQGRLRNGFFHRFTPRSMLQEFQASFGDLPGWNDDALVFPTHNGVIDLNYWQIKGAPSSLEATRTRRQVAGALVRKVSQAELVILTLGLTEAWYHKPTGLYANFTNPSLLTRNSTDFELHCLTVEDTVECLRGINAILRQNCFNDYNIVVTVSPVPLTATFSDKDIIIANADSKSTLRAAALQFVNECDNAHYFPSYEIVTYSNPEMAWRPDRIHVNPKMVRHIVDTFVGAYYEGKSPRQDIAAWSSARVPSVSAVERHRSWLDQPALVHPKADKV